MSRQPEPLHPLLVELFKLLPPPDTPWPAVDRIVWLGACWAIFRLIYGDVGEIEITVRGAD
jgi:hypothetical protein